MLHYCIVCTQRYQYWKTQGTENQCQPTWGAGNQCPEKCTLKISAMRTTLKRSAHQISASGTDFQRVYFPQWVWWNFIHVVGWRSRMRHSIDVHSYTCSVVICAWSDYQVLSIICRLYRCTLCAVLWLAESQPAALCQHFIGKSPQGSWEEAGWLDLSPSIKRWTIVVTSRWWWRLFEVFLAL